MSRLNALGRVSILALLLLGGCTTKEKCALCKAKIPEPTACGDEFDDEAARKFDKTLRERTDGHAFLLLSGGGSRGAFGAGVINGWKSQDRPETFDLVTGISTGAIQATWAFLGLDTEMKSAFTEIDNAEVRRKQPFWMLSKRGEYSLAPLKKTLKERISDDMILDVGRAYRDHGRQLWIGTTNMETGQFCKWNMGRLGQEAVKAFKKHKDTKHEAVKRILDRYRALIVASSSGPPVFAPQKIDGYTQADGGVSQMIFFEALEKTKPFFESVDFKSEPLPLNVYAVVNGKLVLSQKCLPSGIAPIVGYAGRAIGIMQKNAMMSSLYRINYELDQFMRSIGLSHDAWNYRTVWIQADVKLDKSENFCPKEMRKLYDIGFSVGKRGQWCDGLPSTVADQEDTCWIPEAGKNQCAVGEEG